MNELPKQYNPHDVEDKIYKRWETKGYFHAKVNPEKKPFTIIIPPPNVTGVLHMGHALNNTIQDILVRYHRMKGFEALWMPGTDHAGIATQNVVERMIAKEGKKKDDFGREKFLEKVWKWKEDHGSTIIRQLKKLGSSCDWDRERFTMDEEYSKAVQETFIRLYEEKLIFRGNYIINWCPRCLTALSDEEAAHKDLDGMLYYIKYPIKSNTMYDVRGTKYDYIVVATTRPETLLGDTAIAINPTDERFRDLENATVILPLVERELKFVKDDVVDKEFGTGCVKVTPAHDPNDFAIAQRHDLEIIVVMNPDGTMNENALDYRGMDRFEAREAILEDLKERKLLLKAEPHKHAVGHCYRCHTVVEPYLSKQWFVDMPKLAKKAIQVVEEGKIKFYPERWTKVYLNWMYNIRPWCISRQIWWGHRIPVYYCRECQKQANELMANSSWQNNKTEKDVIVSRTKPEKCPKCGSTDIYQDTDVLDTWFSSWLWPFATFGWPFDSAHSSELMAQGQNPTPQNPKQTELEYFYPTNTLVTAQEIIFFWVARMIMAGLHFIGDIPFRDVYIHGTIRDDSGKKMSKSLGNVIDPLDIIEKVGADALRYSIISITSGGQDIYLNEKKFETGRNFANKIWNASRFILMNLENVPNEDLCFFYKNSELKLPSKWILSRFYTTLKNVEKAIVGYNFNEAALLIYKFFWNDFCDWYIELSKQTIKDKDTQLILYKVLEKSLRMLHPIMPFITEEIWQTLTGKAGSTIMLEPWPHIQEQMILPELEKEMDLIIESITNIRNVRSTWTIDQSKKIDVFIKAGDDKSIVILNEYSKYLKEFAKIESLVISDDVKKPPMSATCVIANILEIYIPLSGIIDIQKERIKLAAQIDKTKRSVSSTEARLNNKDFTSKAPEEIIEKEKEKVAELTETIKKLETNLHDLE